MTALSSIKPFLPFLLTFVLPRALAYYRSIKVAIKTRPPPCPLPTGASRALNILCISIVIFLLASLPGILYSAQPNIFELTGSRYYIPTDVLFTRLSLVRPLTSFDEALREKITTPIARILYLRFGPQTLVGCSFCQPTDIISYLLYHLSLNLILPHLVHLLLLGLATSGAIVGAEIKSRFRNKAALLALGLAALDVYLVARFPIPIPNQHSLFPPRGLYWTLLTLRPLSVCLFDIMLASIIYLASTNRLPFFFDSSPKLSASDEAERQKQQLHKLVSTSVALQTALTKLRACNMAKNVVVKDVRGLKNCEDAYWRAAADVATNVAEKTERNHRRMSDSIWQDKPVIEAMVSATSSKGTENGSTKAQPDLAQMRKEARIWVDAITAGLELEEQEKG